jgi:hypothetical protein
MKLRVVYDCTVLKERERVETDSSQSSPNTNELGTPVGRTRASSIRTRPRSSRAGELLMSDVRSALEQCRPWDDDDDRSDLTVVEADEARPTGSRRCSTSIDSLDELGPPQSDVIVRSLQEMIGDGETDVEAEEHGEELSREIEMALEGAHRSGSMPDGVEIIATTPDGSRLLRSNRGGATYEIETTTTVERMTTTMRFRAVGGSRASSSARMIESFAGEEATEIDQDGWVEVGASSGMPQVANGTRALMSIGASSVGATARQHTIDDPREGGQKLQVGTDGPPLVLPWSSLLTSVGCIAVCAPYNHQEAHSTATNNP